MQARLVLRLMPWLNFGLSYSKGMRFAYHSGQKKMHTCWERQPAVLSPSQRPRSFWSAPRIATWSSDLGSNTWSRLAVLSSGVGTTLPMYLFPSGSVSIRESSATFCFDGYRGFFYGEISYKFWETKEQNAMDVFLHDFCTTLLVS